MSTEKETLQASGEHPAPCARHCEAVAFEIEIRRLTAERDAMAARLAELEGQTDNLLSACHRLALELECLLLDTKDSASVSRWWDSAMAALDGWHKAKDAIIAHILTAEHESDPLKAIQDLLAYHTDIAVDPRVSGAAAGLVEQAKAEEREACAKVCESRQTPGTGSVAILQGAADAILARGQK